MSAFVNDMKQYNQLDKKYPVELFLDELISQYKEFRRYTIIVNNKGGHVTDNEDVEKVTISTTHHQVDIALNRNSFYDLLPNAFKHSKPYRNSIESPKTLDDQQTGEEINITRFFFIFEQLLFRLRLLIERDKRSLLQFRSIYFTQVLLLPEYWTDRVRVNFLKLAPVILKQKKILNDICYIIKETLELDHIKINKGTFCLPTSPSVAGCKLGNFILGSDHLIGSIIKLHQSAWTIQLGEISAADYSENYQYGGHKKNILVDLCDWFLPYEVRCSYNYTIKEQDRYLRLDGDYYNILGYTTYL